MTQVLHTGDTHLGYEQYHSPDRREDFMAAFRQVVEDAKTADVDAVVHAGDLFHDRRPRLDDVLETQAVLRELADAEIPFLAVVGNHERKREAQWLDLYESTGVATRLGTEPVVVGEVALYGLDHVPRSRRDDLDYEFEPADATTTALVAHGRFKPFDYGTWDLPAVLGEATVDVDVALLGDQHEPATTQIDGTWATYCGSTERASASERDPRGYNLVAVEDGTVDIRRRGLDTRTFVYVDLELSPSEGPERIRQRVGEHDLDDAVVHVRLTGDGEPVSPAAIEEFAVEEGALLARVNDQRTIEAEAEASVAFADPDAAVADRLRDVGLSDAARAVDETVRSAAVADANVADRVERAVREQVRAEDPAVFEPASDEGGRNVDPSGDGPQDGPDEEAATTNDDESPTADEESSTTDDGSPTTADDECVTTDDAATDETPADGSTEADQPAVEADEPDQASMTDFDA